MKKSILFSILTALFLSCTSTEQPSTDQPPNIVLFFVDDMGWQDCSVPFWDKETDFNRLYRTPNMQKLAAQGVKFTQAYATPVCSPTRISLITGMNAARHRVTNWTLMQNRMKPAELRHTELDIPLWNVNGINPGISDSLSVQATTLPQLLQQNNYKTIHVGKAHFGAVGLTGANPLNLGFDVNIAGHAAGAPESYHGLTNFGNGIEGKEVWAVPGLEKYHGQDIHLSEALTIEALNVLDTLDRKDPFFLYMAHYAVHTPIMPDNRFVQHYYDLGIDSTEAKYASMVEGMDKSLGDIMDYLEEKELSQNTIIMFMSDNGGLSAVARGGIRHSHNKPLSSGKGSLHEGGIREPMIVKWPGVIEPNTSCNQRVIIEDFYPTIIEMAQIHSYDIIQTIDGISFVDQLQNPTNESKDDRALVWHFPNVWGPSGPGIGTGSSIRHGDYKLIYYHDSRDLELFNINEDIGETINLINSHQGKARELAQKLSDYLQDVDAQMPIVKATKKQVPYPIEMFN